MSAKNFPYELPTFYDLFRNGVDRYRPNYDRVFGPTRPTEEMVQRKREIVKKLSRELSEQIVKA